MITTKYTEKLKKDEGGLCFWSAHGCRYSGTYGNPRKDSWSFSIITDAIAMRKTEGRAFSSFLISRDGG